MEVDTILHISKELKWKIYFSIHLYHFALQCLKLFLGTSNPSPQNLIHVEAQEPIVHVHSQSPVGFSIIHQLILRHFPVVKNPPGALLHILMEEDVEAS